MQEGAEGKDWLPDDASKDASGGNNEAASLRRGTTEGCGKAEFSSGANGRQGSCRVNGSNRAEVSACNHTQGVYHRKEEDRKGQKEGRVGAPTGGNHNLRCDNKAGFLEAEK